MAFFHAHLSKRQTQDIALVGAILDDGISCITSTNCKIIPAPPLGGNRVVQERTDFFFGSDDFLVWPQPFNPALPHLPFIRCRDTDLAMTNRQQLWILPETSDFQVTDTEFCTGMGKIRSNMVSCLQNFHQELTARRDRYTEKIPDQPGSLHLNQLFLQAQALMSRLQEVPMGFRAARRTFRAVQRSLLEAEAFLDHHLVHKGRLISTASLSVIPTVGVFVYTQDDAFKFQSMGIRQWLIRPYEVVLQSRIKDVAHLHLPEHELLSVELMPRTQPIFLGAASDIRMYTAIVNFGRNCIRFPDPFHAHALPEPLKSLAGPIRLNYQRQRALTPRQRYFKSQNECE